MKRIYKYSGKMIITILFISLIACFSLTVAVSAQTPVPSPSTPASTTSPPVSGVPINPDWNPPTPPLLNRDEATTDIIADARPAVVAITVSTVTLDFFNQPGVQQGAGSGWIIDSSGIIVTNNHVVGDAQTISVELNDGRVLNATMVATDPISDLAVIKIDADNLTAVPVGDSSKLVVGQRVIAIGNSLGLGISATEGIVSALAVSINPGTQAFYDLIQTDAAINPGNSGGPLLNSAGEVVGINSIKIAEVGIESMGYAISINEAMPVIRQLVQNGVAARSYIGVELQTVTPAIASIFELTQDKGALITRVVPNSPAVQAGLQPGDVIISINDTEVVAAADAARIIRSTQVGEQLEISYVRDGTQATTTVTTIQSPVSD
jgi:serine protease Do